MRISKRKYAITGAGRGLGAALAIVMADAGARVVLLGRSQDALMATAQAILQRTGQVVSTVVCDLADRDSVAAAGALVTHEHRDLDGLIHNGTMWLPGPLADLSDADIQTCIGSASTGALILTRHLLPNLLARPDADIHTVVSTAGLMNFPLRACSVAFTAAKFAQAGFVQGLAQELSGTSVRVTSIFPDDFNDCSPTEAEWQTVADHDRTLSNREVVDAILFILNLPRRISVRSLVIQ